MRKLSLFLILACTAIIASAQGYNLKDANLKGFVVSTETCEIDFSYKFGEIVKSDNPKSRYFVLYNESGNKIEDNYNGNIGYYKYNEQGQIIELSGESFNQKFSYYPDGKLKSVEDQGASSNIRVRDLRVIYDGPDYFIPKRVYKYDNGITSIHIYNESGELTNIDEITNSTYTRNAYKADFYEDKVRYTLTRDINNRIVHVKSLINDKTPGFPILINYNQNCDTLTISTRYESFDKKIKFEYEYDSYGNWTTCKKYRMAYDTEGGNYEYKDGYKLISWRERKIEYANNKEGVIQALENRSAKIAEEIRIKEEEAKAQHAEKLKEKIKEVLKDDREENLFAQRHLYKDGANRFYYIDKTNPTRYNYENANGGIGCFFFPDNNTLSFNHPQYGNVSAQFTDDENIFLIDFYLNGNKTTVIGKYISHRQMWLTIVVEQQHYNYNQTEQEILDAINKENQILNDTYKTCIANHIKEIPSLSSLDNVKLTLVDVNGTVKSIQFDNTTVELVLADNSKLPRFSLDKIKRIVAKDNIKYDAIAYYSKDLSNIIYVMYVGFNRIGIMVNSQGKVYELDKKCSKELVKTIIAN